jgi:hypothetical protein
MGIFDFLTPKADGFAYDPMRLPAGADPENDPVVGYDELGQKIRRSRFDGTQYLFEMAPPKTQSVIKGAYREATANPLGFTGDLLSNAVQSAWDAISVPARSMAGEPLTYGDIAGLSGLMTFNSPANLLDYDPNVTRIFAGPKAVTADKNALSRAKRMSAEGADRNDIWSQTGWFQLGDGQWRFEIDDRDVGLRRPGESARLAENMRQEASDIKAGITARNQDLKTQPDLFPATIRKENAILSREAERLKEEASSNYGPDWNPSTLGQRATYALTDSEIQRAYPELMRNTIVRTDQKLGGPYGAYTEDMGNLEMAPEAYIRGAENPLQRDPRGTLLHEFQHAVQGYEGFARGSNTDRARELLINQRDEAIGKARDNYSNLFVSAPDELKKLLIDYTGAKNLGNLEEMRAIEKDVFNFPQGRDLIYAHNAVDAAASEIITKEKAFDAYERHLGELEARLVQERRDLTPSQRQAVAPWNMANYIPENQQIKSFEVAPIRPRDVFSTDTPLLSEWDQLVVGPR